MRVSAFSFCLAVVLGSRVLAPGLVGSELSDQAQRLEDTGDSGRAREVWARAVREAPEDGATLEKHAQFLERYKDPRARDEYRRSAGLYSRAGKPDAAAGAARRAYLLDLIAGDRTAAAADLASYKSFAPAAAASLQLPPAQPPAAAQTQTIRIPGPLHSFARMVAVAPDIQPEELLTAVARNVVLNGYQATKGAEELEETEYLKLVQRYLSQARELDKLAGADKVIRVPSCESTQTGDLLRVLGFRMRGGCGSELVLETVNAARAFITTDSGFPLADLEQALRTDKPFAYEYRSSTAPVLYGPDYWISAKEKREGDFLDAFLGDPALCRFYLGMSKLDPETADALRRTVSATRLRALASVLDFFGGNFEIREGKAQVPGGAHTAAAWGDLAGASPDKGAEFFERLMAKDDGWLASLYDALARIQGPVRDYLTDPARLRRYYAAIRGRITTPGPARPVFRSNAEMMLLTTRLRIDPDGRVHIPGSIDIWKELFEKNPKGKYDVRLSRAAASWREPDDVVEALFAMCRKPVDNEPLNMFMTLTDIDRNRQQPLAAATVRRLVQGWPVYGAQYAIFNDVPSLTDKTILAWMDLAASLDRIGDSSLRMDGIGMMQGLTGLWQIFSRQGSIPADKADETLAAILAPFPGLKTEQTLFDIGRSGVNTLLKATGAPAGNVQDGMLGLLAGGPRPDDSEPRTELVQQEKRIFEAQKLLALDLLFEVADNLTAVTKGEKLNAQLASRLSARVAEIQLPRS
ncbi:MAG TPA: hypothetical protein VEF06_12635, partial [Bryobacteraceae bacterium]|nr:hypothetical protein [Bryobacteraceae bacterium]